jgi:hypothetical protein
MGMKTALKQPFANLRPHRIADHVVRRIADLARLLPALSGTDGEIRAEPAMREGEAPSEPPVTK